MDSLVVDRILTKHCRALPPCVGKCVTVISMLQDHFLFEFFKIILYFTFNLFYILSHL